MSQGPDPPLFKYVFKLMEKIVLSIEIRSKHFQILTLVDLLQILNDCIQRLLPKKGETTQTQRYISDVKDLCRLLTNSDPPFSISWDFNKGGHFDTNLFDEYMQCGNKIHFVVWPVLYTCEGGDVLCKGVAEAVHDVQKDEDKKAAFANIDDYTSHQVLSSAQNSTDPQQKALRYRDCYTFL